ncbi:MAG TPA: GAF domain-containing protein, partial [Thermoanaerobaculia bacterium]|nr:GAF domain-containing protein [Thermoanaerobaculia bacterium]
MFDAPQASRESHLDSRELRFQRFWRVLERISHGTTLDEVLNFIYEEFREEIPFDRLSFATIDESGEQVLARWARSESPTRIAAGYSQRLAASGLMQVSLTKQPRIIGDLRSYLREHPGSRSTALLVEEGQRSSLTCPLVVEDRPIGFLFFNAQEPHVYSAEHADFFMQLSTILAIYVERARLYDELIEEKRGAEHQRHLLSEELARHREELDLARKVQRGLIHGSFPEGSGIQAEMLYEPAEVIGGDLVDCIALGERSGLVFVAD